MLLRETRNLVQFLCACKISSPTDKNGKNQTKTDLLPNILEHFVCILKSHEKPILKIICIELGCRISKCSIYSKLLPPVLGLGTNF